jgi:hypothetical protein
VPIFVFLFEMPLSLGFSGGSEFFIHEMADAQ